MKKGLFIINNVAYLDIGMTQFATFSYFDEASQQTKTTSFEIQDATYLAEAIAGIASAKNIDTIVCNNARGLGLREAVNQIVKKEFSYRSIDFIPA